MEFLLSEFPGLWAPKAGWVSKVEDEGPRYLRAQRLGMKGVPPWDCELTPTYPRSQRREPFPNSGEGLNLR